MPCAHRFNAVARVYVPASFAKIGAKFPEPLRNSTHVDAATLLNQTLNEEKATDKKLTEMTESQINRKVA